jgi:hypothetical protein
MTRLTLPKKDGKGFEAPHNDEGQYVVGPGKDGKPVCIYDPWPHQLLFHASTAPNLLELGTRGTGKSVMIRWDAIMRCLAIPGFQALIVRRTMPELRKSHLTSIPLDMKKLGGEENGYVWLSTFSLAKFPNGSQITFAHCETEADILNFLSSEYGAIYFDELSTFTLTQFLQISAAARAPEDAGYVAIVRAGSNPLGMGAEWMKQWFIDKDVRLEDYPDYHPDDFEWHFSTMEDNPSINRKEYEKRLRNLPEHVRRAWLRGEFVIEGAYFGDFRKFKQDESEWHVIRSEPTWNGLPISDPKHASWISVYRAIDWGWKPDPAVCLWIAVLPNGRAIVFKERRWNETLAEDVAKEIVKESEGMNVVDTFGDPVMFLKDGQDVFSIAEQFEMNGVPMTASVNDRVKYGYAIHDYLNRIIDQKPQLQIVESGARDLIRTFPMMRMDPLNPAKIANGEDHWVVALAYFCMGLATPAQDPTKSDIPYWMRPKPRRRTY